MSSFSIALSGLTAASSDLDVTANNIANSNTTGFKSSRVEFADVYASGGASLNSSSIGEGVRLAATAQQFTQGNISTTGANLDLAISGDGFFTLKDPNGFVYSRNGQFSEDSNGNVVSSTGQFLQVYPPVPTGGFNTGALQNLNLQTGESAPLPTSAGTVILNLPANATPPPVGPFNPANAATYNNSTSTTIYDSLGNSYPATMFFRNTGVNAWSVYMTVGGQTLGPQALTFSATGAVATPVGGALAFTPFNPPSGATQGGTITFDFSQTTQYGGQFAVSALTQNGYTTGQLSTVSINPTGIVSAVYTNGRSTQLGQLAMANFPNPQGLQELGDTNWAATFSSGNVVQGTATSAGFGSIQSGALESSNVDLTTELVNMITAQRAFDSNAQVITTSNQLSQTVINITH